MKERPIIFSTESVKATLEGRKSQTRRTWGLEEINKNPDEWLYSEGSSPPGRFTFYNQQDDSIVTVKCPYGQAGDGLWVKETWASENRYNNLKPSEIPQTAKIFYLASVDYDPFEMGKVRSALFMPRHFSRISLENTIDPFPQRLQEISIADAIAEGCSLDFDMAHFGNYTDPVSKFYNLWDSLNAKRGYGRETNPWVRVISFSLTKEEQM